MERHDDDKSWLKIGLSIALGIWCMNLVMALTMGIVGEGPAAGVFGDAFGAVNALFSSVAVAAAVWAVRLQQEELRDTRREFEKQTLIHDEHLALLKGERIARERLLKLEHSPRLMLRSNPYSRGVFVMKLINAGSSIHDLRVTSYGSSHMKLKSCNVSPDTILERNGEASIIWSFEEFKAVASGSFDVEIEYKTLLNDVEAVVLTTKVP